MGREFPAAMYSVDGGYTWIPSSSCSEFFGVFQDCSKSLDSNAYVVTGDFMYYIPGSEDLAGVGISVDGGDVYSMNDWGNHIYIYIYMLYINIYVNIIGIDHWSRYSSFFNASFGYISGGKWPLTQSLNNMQTIILDENEAEKSNSIIYIYNNNNNNN
jgi:hypothetical protein